MRGISIETLAGLRLVPNQDSVTIGTLDWLINVHCKELQEPWMTLDEFLKSGFVGFCWINQVDYIENSYFDGEIFFESSTGSHCYQTYNITHVMPIHKPEPPR